MTDQQQQVPSGDLVKFAQQQRDFANIDFVKLQPRRRDQAAIDAPVDVALVPRGMEVKSLKPLLDEYLPAPERIKGAATATTLQSFIEHTNRAKRAESALFAKPDRKTPSLTAVINYDAGNGGTAGWRDHRVTYAFPVSEPWVAWGVSHGTKLTQLEFAEHIENRLADVIEPPDANKTEDAALIALADRLGARFAGAAALLQLSRGLKITVDSTVGQTLNTSTGETSVTFEERHQVQGAGGSEVVKVPNFFLIAIPVFDRGPAYRLAVRLRYRKDGPRLLWFYDIYQADRAFMDAFDAACGTAREATSLPLFYGTPEA